MPFLLSEVALLLETASIPRLACCTTPLLLASLLPLLRRHAPLYETLWAILVCVFLAVILLLPRELESVGRVALAELLAPRR